MKKSVLYEELSTKLRSEITNCVWLVETRVYYTTNELRIISAFYLVYMACHLSTTDDRIRKLHNNS